MPRELFDVQRQNFWTESIHKEAYTRLAWHEKYSKEFARDSVKNAQTKRLQDKFPPIVHNIPAVLSLKAQKKNHRKENLADIEKKKSDELAALAGRDPNALLVEMRPVTPHTRTQLYKGFSKEGTGRYAYLQFRKLKKPEDKYDFPITSSWDYGWRLDDVVKEFHAPKFGRSRIVKDSFYRTNGIL
ncbi:hypothetical protein BSL78_15623 [Apostichopus japonicus]|uniref:Sperm microtubule inner protein 1 C-terminal domain-containing protein n=1 Tax=Stichopus japonicus TaxID=307972 RepID=A0A2G8KHL9_STIJA|nr:hypothetical protein BSL78_30216 [Apostichopus japonicus]PIK47501.1 hypothetical protein BSL78_15623 [Apostichopus japonicus]